MNVVLAPIDFSPTTDAVIAVARALAGWLGGRMVLLHVTKPSGMMASPGALAKNLADLNEQFAGSSWLRLEQWRERLESEFVPIDVIHLTGQPAPLIVKQAKRLNAAFVVVGSHGHTALRDLLLGSTATDVIRRAPCPAIIVPRAFRLEKAAMKRKRLKPPCTARPRRPASAAA